MGFPITPRYFLRFRHSDVGLTPTFSFFKRATDLVAVAPPTVYEVGGGTYYFDWTFSAKTDPTIVFEVDGGASIPTEEVRYIGDTISPKDYFLDEPVSQVNDDVWANNTGYSAGTKGKRVDQLGDPADASSVASLFGKTMAARESVRGDSAGATNGNSVKDVYGRVGAPVAGSLSADLQNDTSAIESAISGVSMAVSAIVPPDNAGISAINSNMSNLSAMMTRVLGMLHENSVLDKLTYDPATNNLLSARFRLYSNSTDAQAAQAAGDLADDVTRIAQYSIVAQYSGDNMLNYLVVKEYPLEV